MDGDPALLDATDRNTPAKLDVHLILDDAGIHKAPLTSTTAAFRFSLRSFARFIGEPLSAALNSACDMPRISRAGVRASRPRSTWRGANGDSAGCSDANRRFHGHTSWEEWRYDHSAVPLTTGLKPPGATGT